MGHRNHDRIARLQDAIGKKSHHYNERLFAGATSDELQPLLEEIEKLVIELESLLVPKHPNPAQWMERYE